MKSFLSKPAPKLTGELLPPGDKSISHRAVMLSALAAGESRFTNFLAAEDCLHTIDAFQKMSVSVKCEQRQVRVKGAGLLGLQKPSSELYLGNSGTSMRLLLGILAAQNFESTLSGDPSLSVRPMKRVTDPLRKMGAQIFGREDANFAPLLIRGSQLKGIKHLNVPASAQVKSSILLAGLYAEGETVIDEPSSSRDHTERMFKIFGIPLQIKGAQISVRPVKEIRAVQMQIPGDISSAAFFIVAACILPDSNFVIRDVGLNPTRIGILEVLKEMGADLQWKITGKHEEPTGEISVKTSKLRGIKINGSIIPKIIDELPILMIACALADGESVITDARELRVKETDRIKSMVSGIQSIGGIAKELEDGCVIEGVKVLKGGKVSSFADHRTAMSFAIAGLRSERGVEVDDVECINTSYPGFFEDLSRAASV